MTTWLHNHPTWERTSWAVMLVTYERTTSLLHSRCWPIDWNPNLRLLSITGPLPKKRGFCLTFEKAPWIHDNNLDRPITGAVGEYPHAA